VFPYSGLQNYKKKLNLQIFFVILLKIFCQMKKVVLLRHGESVWNKENRFTGWTDVDLSETGIKEAQEAAELLLKEGYHFDICFTSYLKRAIKTLNVVLEGMDMLHLPVYKSWRLNEKHYGMLQGLNKAETAAKYGDEQVKIWRRSYDIAPLPIPEDDARNTRKDPKYKDVEPNLIPLTEALIDTVARAIPYWNEEILPALKDNDQIIVAAHGNSLRAIIKHLKNISDQDIISLNLPTAMPYVFEFDDNLNFVKDYFLGDPEKIKRKMDAVANQGKAK
jgi:2,3-bisphosphoglycerate-dependent phosphoglycerate mutase